MEEGERIYFSFYSRWSTNGLHFNNLERRKKYTDTTAMANSIVNVMMCVSIIEMEST